MVVESRKLLRRGKRRLTRAARTLRHWKNAVGDPSAKLVILLYHRVLPDATCNPLDTIVSVETFTRQLEAVARRYPVVSLEDALTTRRVGQRPGRVRVALTFDDGYWDNYDIVCPILKRKGWTATFFLPTRYIGGRRPLWDWEVVRGLTQCADIKDVPVGAARVRRAPHEAPLAFAYRVMDAMKAASLETMQGALDVLRQRARSRWPQEHFYDRCLTWDEARAMAEGGMEIGAHSVSHRSLARLPLDDALAEIRESKQAIEAHVPGPCRHFAFPFGSRNDYTPRLIEAVHAAGFQTSLLNIHGYNRLGRGVMDFKRIIMTETTNPGHLLG